MSDRAISDVLASVLGEVYCYIIFWTIIPNINTLLLSKKMKHNTQCQIIYVLIYNFCREAKGTKG